MTLLTATTSDAVQDAIRAAASQPTVNFTPAHIVKVGTAGGRDTLGNWNLDATGDGAAIVKTIIGVLAMGMSEGSEDVFAGEPGRFQFGAKSMAMALAIKFDERADGGLVWTNRNEAGDDSGWGISANADGGMSLTINGSLAEIDVSTAIDVADGDWRWLIMGYVQGTTTGYLICDDFSISQLLNVGDYTSTDGRPATGSAEAGADGAIARIIVWRGTAADNIATHAAAMIANLQAEIAAAAATQTYDISWLDVVGVAPELASVAEDFQDLILSVANSTFRIDLFGGEDSSKLKLARCYYAAHIGTETGAGASSGPVISETIGPVTLQYASLTRSTVELLELTAYGRKLLFLINTSDARVFGWAP